MNGFTETWERDAEGTVCIKAICNLCGDSRLLNNWGGSLDKWKGQHVCAGVEQRLTRRASDKQHLFVPTDGFRTCRVCGLPKRNEVHSATNPAKCLG
jgi:hypothetical protein